MRTVSLAIGCLAFVGAPALAQEHEHSPYANQTPSGIASLSLEELQELQTGAGMGMARAAELNRYPGPLHTLELADSLKLTPEQRARVAAVRQAMLDRAVALGERIIDGERILSRRFEHGHIDSTSLADATADLGRLYGELRYVHLAAHLAMKQLLAPVGRLYGELRYVHLAAHLAMKQLLAPDQVAAYDRLRGYVREP
jgi:Spy/CpxP family protein refolding chaperone